jgi:4-amino-4-deoxy-L-arabinose transferase-like glycosyltransferase
MTISGQQRVQFLGVVLLSGIIWFALLGYRDLFDPDEGRYAQIPAAMVATGDWLTPRLNGIKYFEKPALQYWLSAAIFRVAGEGNATARLVPALAGYLAAAFAALLALRLFGARAAMFAFLLCSSSLMWVVMGHLLTLDMLVSSLLFVGMGCLAIAQGCRSDTRRLRNWMLAGWAALALAVLTKGLIGLALPVASVLVYSVWQRDWQIWTHLRLGRGLLLFLLLVAPWFVAVSLENPEFARFFFIHEHWDRYTSGVHNREGPVYYFVPFLLLGLLPWLAAGLAALLRPACGWRPRNAGQFDPLRLLWSFVVVTFVFFSIGNSKLPAYILPIMPVVAVLAAGKLAQARALGPDRWLLALLGPLVLLLAFHIDRLADERFALHMWLDYRPWLYASGCLLLAAAGAVFVLGRKPLAACAASSIFCLLAFQSMVWGTQSIAEARSSRLLAHAIARSIPADAPIYTVATFPESAAFYLGRSFRVVHYTGELAFGLEQEPQLTIRGLDQFLAEWQRTRSAAMIVENEDLEKLFPGRNLGKIVYLGPKRTVIVRDARVEP